jgi:hypothetical protein
MRRAMQQSRDGERGAIALLAAVVFLVVAGFVAFSMNVAHKATARTQLQLAMDAAALAAALSLDGNPASATLPSDVDKAVQVANDYANVYLLDRNPITFSSSDLQAGFWNPAVKTFTPEGATVRFDGHDSVLDRNLTPQLFNAFRVKMKTDGIGGHSDGLDVWFSGFLGYTGKMTVSASAVAIHGGACASDNGCTVPMVVPRCAIIDNGGFVNCFNEVTLYFDRGDPSDAALTDLTQPSDTVTLDEESGQMEAAAKCTNPTITANSDVAVGHPRDLYTSNAITSMRSPTNMICTDYSPGSQPSDVCKRFTFPVVDTGGCMSGGNVQNRSVATPLGFFRGVITGTSDPNNSTATPYVKVYIDCTRPSSAPGGCPNFGMDSKTLRLVQ